MHGKFIVFLRPVVSTFLDEVFVYRTFADKTIEFLTVNTEGLVVISKVTADLSLPEQVRPLMVLPHDAAREIVQAFINYGEEKMFERPSESRTAGELKAQTAHLNDLRTLLKLK